jgi:hypothetical protein
MPTTGSFALLMRVDYKSSELKDIHTWKKPQLVLTPVLSETRTDVINKDTLNELSAFEQLDNMSDNGKVDALQNARGAIYNTINQEVSNPYLHYLVNASILNGVTGSKTSFDILTNVKDYVKIETTTSDTGVYTYRTGIMDYFLEIQNAGKAEEIK